MSKGAFTVGLFLAAAGVAGAAQATIAVSPDATETDRRARSSAITQRNSRRAAARRRVYASIDRAAREVCDDTGEFVLRASFAACERSAIADAVARGRQPATHGGLQRSFSRVPARRSDVAAAYTRNHRDRRLRAAS